MDLGNVFEQVLQNSISQLPLQQPVQHHMRFANPMLSIFNYWRSKVIQIHAKWKKVKDTFELGKLDTRTISIEKKFENKKAPKFKLGDGVKILGSNIRIFKKLHKKFGMWREEMRELIGKDAIVMNLLSPSAIVVALIENGETVQIHGFALEPVQTEAYGIHWQNNTDFKTNDEVVIGVDNGVLIFLQKLVRKTPYARAVQFVGTIGRVVAFFKGEVVVTFDEVTHEMFNPAALKRYTGPRGGNTTNLTRILANTPEIGKKVVVKNNLKYVMDLQRGHGEWHYKMTKFLGKIGTVTDHIGMDVIVEFNPFERYWLNVQNVEEVKRKRHKFSSGTDIKLRSFAVGDVVRLNIDPEDLHSILTLLRLPLEFQVIISDCAEFMGYVDQRRGVIDFGDGVEFTFELNLLTKVGDAVKELYLKLRQSDKTIGVGKKVMIWTGPETFAKTCVSNFKDGFEKGLTEVATVKGYDDQGNAIIQYKGDDDMYSLPDEYLCAPRPDWISRPGEFRFIDWKNEPIKLPITISAVEAQILHSVTEVLKSNGESAAVKWESVIRDDVSREDKRNINIKFLAELEDSEQFFEKFKSKLASENILVDAYDDKVIVKTDAFIFPISFDFASFNEVPEPDDKIQFSTSSSPVNVGSTLSVNEKDCSSTSAEDGQAAFSKGSSDMAEQKTKSSVSEKVEEMPIPENSSNPFVQGTYNIQIPNGVKQVVLQLGGRTNAPSLPNQVADTGPDDGNLENIIGNSVPGTTIDMRVDGPVNIHDSLIRKVEQS